MSYYFEFEDRDKVEVKAFTANPHQYLYCGQPAKTAGQYTYTVAVLVPTDLFEAFAKQYPDRQKELTKKFGNNIFVGILRSTMAVGVPYGSYVPIQWNPHMNRFDIITTKLVNPKLLVSMKYAPGNTIAVATVVPDADVPAI